MRVKEKRWRPIKRKLTENQLEEHKYLVEFYEKARVYWLTEIRHPDNIKKWLKPNTPISYKDIAKELWHTNNKIHLMDKTKEVWEHREKIKRDLMKEMQSNSEKILNKTFDLEKWWFKMKDSERARLALDFKKSTDKAYNPSQSIDLNINELDFSDLDYLKSQLSEELWLLKNTNE